MILDDTAPHSGGDLEILREFKSIPGTPVLGVVPYHTQLSLHT